MTKSMRICILTFHRCINYGSYWQAKCLADGLKLRGHHVWILDHFSARVNIAEWKTAFRPVLPTHVPETDYPLYRAKTELFFKLFDKLPLSTPFPLDQPQDMEEYDIAVVGSDEVWNLTHPWYGHQPLFYGEGLKAKKIISYAASFGNYPAVWGLDAVWAQKLQNFDMISVRDENAAEIVKNTLGYQPDMVLDPCLQFPLVPDAGEDPWGGKDYVAVYGHNFSDSYIAMVQQWAKKNGLPLVSIGYRNDWANEQWLTAGPHEFARFIAQSTAVATNFFHGCVFALRNARPFVCETTSYRSLKITGLMNKTGATKHLVSSATPFEAYNECLGTPVADSILRNIEHLRQTSDAFLDKALTLKAETV